MDKFEKLIKASAESYEAPYSEAAWKALSGKLGPAKGGGLNWAYASAIIAVVGIAASIWYFKPNNIPPRVEVADTTNIIAPKGKSNGSGINSAAKEEKQNFNQVESNLQFVDKNVVEAASEPTGEEKQENYKLEKAVKPELNNLSGSMNSNNENLIVTPMENIATNQSNLSEIIPKAEANLEAFKNESIQGDLGHFDIKAIADKQVICAGDEVSFSTSIPKLKGIYQWNFGQGEVAQGAYINHLYDKPGTYEVTLNILDPKTRATVNSSESIIITVNKLPVNEISYEFDNSAIPRVNFTQKNKFTTSIFWDIKGFHQTRDESFSKDFRQKGNYVVSCSVTDNNGCKSTSNTIVAIENDYNLLAPTAFTPNGDNLNETFMPKALLLEHPVFIMTIYDKTGKLLFETNDASRPWEGFDVRNSKPVASGSYVWIVQLTNNQNEIETYQGQVTVTR